MKSLSGRPKKCKECGKLFVPVRVFQVWCSPDCAVKLAKKIRAKEKAVEIKKKREAIKTLGDLADQIKKMQSSAELESLALMQKMLKQVPGSPFTRASTTSSRILPFSSI